MKGWKQSGSPRRDCTQPGGPPQFRITPEISRRLTKSLSGRLPGHALAVQRTHDEVTSPVAIMGTPKRGGARESKWRSEGVGVLSEGSQTEKGRSPPPSNPTAKQLASEVEDRFATATFCYCGLKGHLACSCAKKRRDRSHKGIKMAAEGDREGNEAGAPPGKQEYRPFMPSHQSHKNVCACAKAGALTSTMMSWGKCVRGARRFRSPSTQRQDRYGLIGLGSRESEDRRNLLTKPQRRRMGKVPPYAERGSSVSCSWTQLSRNL